MKIWKGQLNKTFRFWAKCLAIFLVVALVATMNPVGKHAKAFAAEANKTNVSAESAEQNSAATSIDNMDDETADNAEVDAESADCAEFDRESSNGAASDAEIESTYDDDVAWDALAEDNSDSIDNTDIEFKNAEYKNADELAFDDEHLALNDELVTSTDDITSSDNKPTYTYKDQYESFIACDSGLDNVEIVKALYKYHFNEQGDAVIIDGIDKIENDETDIQEKDNDKDTINSESGLVSDEKLVADDSGSKDEKSDKGSSFSQEKKQPTLYIPASIKSITKKQIRQKILDTCEAEGVDVSEYLLDVYLGDDDDEEESLTLPVCEIADGAFKDCAEFSQVYIADEYRGLPVTYENMKIGKDAFSQCTNLKKLVCERNVEINNKAFFDTDKLESAVFKKNIDTIGDEAFKGCTNLTTVIWNNACINDFSFSEEQSEDQSATHTFGSYVFDGCDKLENICIPNSITTIGDDALCGIANLKMAVLPNNCTNLNSDLFGADKFAQEENKLASIVVLGADTNFLTDKNNTNSQPTFNGLVNNGETSKTKIFSANATSFTNKALAEKLPVTFEVQTVADALAMYNQPEVKKEEEAIKDDSRVHHQVSKGRGKGTKDDPFVIRNTAELKSFANVVNGGMTDACAVLANDIYFPTDSDGSALVNNNWTSIGTNGAWTGSFDGNNFSINGVSQSHVLSNFFLWDGIDIIAQTGAGIGFYAVLNWAVKVGKIANPAAFVIDCFANAAMFAASYGLRNIPKLTANKKSGFIYKAGNNFEVKDLDLCLDKIHSASKELGGLVSIVDGDGTVTNTNVSGSVESTDLKQKTTYGGFFGKVNCCDVRVSNCVNSCEVSSTTEAERYAGGFAGECNGQVQFNSCTNAGTTIANGANTKEFAMDAIMFGITVAFSAIGFFANSRLPLKTPDNLEDDFAQEIFEYYSRCPACENKEVMAALKEAKLEGVIDQTQTLAELFDEDNIKKHILNNNIHITQEQTNQLAKFSDERFTLMYDFEDKINCVMKQDLSPALNNTKIEELAKKANTNCLGKTSAYRYMDEGIEKQLGYTRLYDMSVYKNYKKTMIAEMSDPQEIYKCLCSQEICSMDERGTMYVCTLDFGNGNGAQNISWYSVEGGSMRKVERDYVLVCCWEKLNAQTVPNISEFNNMLDKIEDDCKKMYTYYCRKNPLDNSFYTVKSYLDFYKPAIKESYNAEDQLLHQIFQSIISQRLLPALTKSYSKASKLTKAIAFTISKLGMQHSFPPLAHDVWTKTHKKKRKANALANDIETYKTSEAVGSGAENADLEKFCDTLKKEDIEEDGIYDKIATRSAILLQEDASYYFDQTNNLHNNIKQRYADHSADFGSLAGIGGGFVGNASNKKSNISFEECISEGNVIAGETAAAYVGLAKNGNYNFNDSSCAAGETITAVDTGKMIDGKRKPSAGGFIGYAQDAHISAFGCSAGATTTANSKSASFVACVGGGVKANFDACASSGFAYIGRSDGHAAGYFGEIAGSSNVNLSNSYCDGAVCGYGANKGYFAGSNVSALHCSNCYFYSDPQIFDAAKFATSYMPGKAADVNDNGITALKDTSKIQSGELCVALNKGIGEGVFGQNFGWYPYKGESDGKDQGANNNSHAEIKWSKTERFERCVPFAGMYVNEYKENENETKYTNLPLTCLGAADVYCTDVVTDENILVKPQGRSYVKKDNNQEFQIVGKNAHSVAAVLVDGEDQTYTLHYDEKTGIYSFTLPQVTANHKIEIKSEAVDFAEKPEIKDGNLYIKSINNMLWLYKHQDNNEGELDGVKCIVLCNDISLGEFKTLSGSDWKGLGTTDKPFTFEFNGQGNTISDMSNSALIANGNKLNVHDLTVKNFSNTNAAVCNISNGDAKFTNVKVTNCSNLESALVHSAQNAKITGCFVDSTCQFASLEDESPVGGLVASVNDNAQVSVENCGLQMNADSAKKHSSVGGMFGWVDSHATIDINNCEVNAQITQRFYENEGSTYQVTQGKNAIAGCIACGKHYVAHISNSAFGGSLNNAAIYACGILGRPADKGSSLKNVYSQFAELNAKDCPRITDGGEALGKMYRQVWQHASTNPITMVDFPGINDIDCEWGCGFDSACFNNVYALVSSNEQKDPKYIFADESQGKDFKGFITADEKEVKADYTLADVTSGKITYQLNDNKSDKVNFVQKVDNTDLSLQCAPTLNLEYASSESKDDDTQKDTTETKEDIHKVGVVYQYKCEDTDDIYYSNFTEQNSYLLKFTYDKEQINVPAREKRIASNHTTAQLAITPKDGYKIDEVNCYVEYKENGQGFEKATNPQLQKSEDLTLLTVENMGADVSVTITTKEITGLAPEGQGTDIDPYKIEKLENLIWMRNEVNNGNLTGDFNAKLISNIDMSGINWKSIGNEQHPFTGKLDGSYVDGIGKKTCLSIYGIHGESLFGHVSGKAQISNISFVAGCDTNNLRGGIVHKTTGNNANVKFSNVSVFGGIASAEGQICVGSILDEADANTEICDCKSSAVVILSYEKDGQHAEGDRNGLGGIVGRISGDACHISGCAFNGSIISSIFSNDCFATSNVGGIVGFINPQVDNAKYCIESCENSGSFIAGIEKAEKHVNEGGIVGGFSTSKLANCIWEKNTDFSEHSELKISKCNNLHDIEGNNNNAAGILGAINYGAKDTQRSYHTADVFIEYSSNRGEIEGDNSCGGILGDVEGDRFDGDSHSLKVDTCVSGAYAVTGKNRGEFAGCCTEVNNIKVNNCYSSDLEKMNAVGKQDGCSVKGDTSVSFEEMQNGSVVAKLNKGSVESGATQIFGQAVNLLDAEADTTPRVILSEKDMGQIVVYTLTHNGGSFYSNYKEENTAWIAAETNDAANLQAAIECAMVPVGGNAEVKVNALNGAYVGDVNVDFNGKDIDIKTPNADRAEYNITYNVKNAGEYVFKCHIKGSEYCPENVDGWYIMKDDNDLLWASNAVNVKHETNIKLKLGHTIDMAGKNFYPIGTAEAPFTGEFIGLAKNPAIIKDEEITEDNCLRVENLNPTGANVNGALFGYAQNATFNGVSVTGVNAKGSAFVYDATNCTIKNVFIHDAKVSYAADAACATQKFAGGVAGRATKSCISNCMVDVQFAPYTNLKNEDVLIGGGIVAKVEGFGNEVVECKTLACSEQGEQNANEIFADSNKSNQSYVGGIVGLIDGNFDALEKAISEISLNKCENNINIGGKNCSAGGIVGGIIASGTKNVKKTDDYAWKIKLYSCTNNGYVGSTNSTIATAGGLIGTVLGYKGNSVHEIDIEYGENNAQVCANTTIGDAYAGGLLGNVDKYKSVRLFNGKSTATKVSTQSTRGKAGYIAGRENEKSRAIECHVVKYVKFGKLALCASCSGNGVTGDCKAAENYPSAAVSPVVTVG